MGEGNATERDRFERGSTAKLTFGITAVLAAASSRMLNESRKHRGGSATLGAMADAQVLDRTYAALANPTRRDLLVALRHRDANITDLAAPLPMSFAGVSRHVGVLESAGLVRREIRGREHWISIVPGRLLRAERWLGQQTACWTTRTDELEAKLRRKRPSR